MDFASVLKVGVLIGISWPALGQARPVQCRLPEELEPQACLICNGAVISVEDAGIKMNSPYPGVGPSSMPEMIMLAKVKVLHVFKGTAPSVIEFRYRVSQPQAVMADGPEHVSLQNGARYRFFLKPDLVRGGFVGVLEGAIDDNFAVEALCPGEADDAPYLRKDEAIKLALDYIKSKDSTEVFDLARTSVYCQPEGRGGASWTVLQNPLRSNLRYSAIMVHDDHTIDTNFLEMNHELR